MYAIVRTGGKQYRVEEGQSLLVERLPVDNGGKAVLEPLLFVDGSNVVDGSDLSKVTVEARVVAHERGPKLRVVKFKPKRGYKRRTGHRQELTRIEVTSIKLGSRRGTGAGATSASGGTRRSPKPVAASGGDPSVEASEAAASGAAAQEAAAPSGSEAGAPEVGASGAAASEAGAKEAPAKPTRSRTRKPAAGDEAADSEAKPKPRRTKPPADEAKAEEDNGA